MSDSFKTAAVILGIVGAYAVGKQKGFTDGVKQCKLILESAIAGSEAKQKKEEDKEES